MGGMFHPTKHGTRKESDRNGDQTKEWGTRRGNPSQITSGGPQKEPIEYHQNWHPMKEFDGRRRPKNEEVNWRKALPVFPGRGPIPVPQRSLLLVPERGCFPSHQVISNIEFLCPNAPKEKSSIRL